MGGSRYKTTGDIMSLSKNEGFADESLQFPSLRDCEKGELLRNHNMN